MDRRAVFLSPLISEKLEGRWRKLRAPLLYSSQKWKRLFEVPALFVTDFASVPRIPFVFSACGDTGHSAAALHDYVCRNGLMSWPEAADLFHEALLANPYPEPRWRANIMWSGVRLGGLLPYKQMPGVLDPREHRCQK